MPTAPPAPPTYAPPVPAEPVPAAPARAAPRPARDRAPAARGRFVRDRFVLHDVDWATYRRLRASPENDGYRFTFDGPTGRLEVEVSQGPLHESVCSLLAYFVMAFRQHGGPRFWPTGAVTLNREDLDRGLDCDESFYLRTRDGAPDLDANRLDLSGGLRPPDLAVEVDVTSPGVSKLPIYAALGVPEVWVWDDADATLTARRLTDAGEYEIVAQSVELPGFPLAAAAELIRDPGERDAGDLQAAFAGRLGGKG